MAICYDRLFHLMIDKKISNAQGYVIYRATSKNGKYKAVSTIKKGSTVSYTNKKLTSKKSY